MLDKWSLRVPEGNKWGAGSGIEKYFKIDFDGIIKFVHLQSL